MATGETLPKKIKRLKAELKDNPTPAKKKSLEAQLYRLDIIKNRVDSQTPISKKPKYPLIVESKKSSTSPDKSMTVAQCLKVIKDKGYKVVKNPSGSITITKLKTPAK